MSHGGCCNCFICNIGKSLGLMENCVCKSSPKKAVKKTAKKVAKKSKSKAKKK